MILVTLKRLCASYAEKGALLMFPLRHSQKFHSKYGLQMGSSQVVTNQNQLTRHSTFSILELLYTGLFRLASRICRINSFYT